LPLLEYACELWDGCTQQEYNKIEQIQKQELPVVAMFVNGSGQNEQSLERTFYRCLLPSFSSFGGGVSEVKIKI
jgi:hypothetical protein